MNGKGFKVFCLQQQEIPLIPTGLTQERHIGELCVELLCKCDECRLFSRVLGQRLAQAHAFAI